MDSEDLVFAMLGVTMVFSLIAIRRRKRFRKYWVNPYLRSRAQTGRFSTAVSSCRTFDNFNTDK